MFITEFKVTGKLVKGQIIGNWSAKSPCALKIETLQTLTLDEDNLNNLISELQTIQTKVKEENVKRIKN